MNVITPCMTWVPILWGQLLGLFMKNRAVDNPIPDLRAFEDPLPELPTVHNPLPELRAVDDTLPDLLKVNDALLDHLAVNNPIPHLPTVDDPQSDLLAINNPLPHLPAVDNPLPDLLVVDDPLSNLLAVNNPLPDFLLVEDPFLAVDEPPDFLAVDNPLPQLQALDSPLPYLPAVDDPLPVLPYHIITNILSRLPAKCVFQCQSVSRILHALATTPFFIHTHLNRATSIMALQSFTQSSDRDIKLYFIDEDAEEAEKIEATTMKLDLCYMLKNSPIVLYGSYDGFLLFSNNSVWDPFFLMWNPITKEQVTVTSPSSHLYVCGFYFHPLKREYEVLFVCKKGAPFEFQILSLGTKSWRNIGSCSYPPCCERPPIIINGVLYWMVDLLSYRSVNGFYPSRSHSIVSFKIEADEFSTMEDAGRPRLSTFDCDMKHLSEMEGQLCLCERLSSTKLVLWVLNQTTMCWVKRRILTLPMEDFQPYFSDWPNKFSMEVEHIKKGELLVRQCHRLLLYNMHLGTCRVVEKKGFECDNFRAMIHTNSLVSLHTDRVISLRR